MILGLHGKMGSGKNTAAARLPFLTDMPVVEVSYARKLKESVAALLDISLEQIEAWKNDPDVYVTIGVMGDFTNRIRPFERTAQSFRTFLQRYGTEAHRNVFGEDFWLDAAMPLDKDYSDALYVVTDVRFQNEAERVRSLGGTVVKVIGPHTDTGTHASEAGVDCDYELDNTLRHDGFARLDAELKGLLDTVMEHDYAVG